VFKEFICTDTKDLLYIYRERAEFIKKKKALAPHTDKWKKKSTTALCKELTGEMDKTVSTPGKEKEVLGV
jgi:hypothetical protein